MLAHACTCIYHVHTHMRRYHEFYGACHMIFRKETPVRVDIPRVLVSKAAAAVMKKCFELIGLRFVDKM